MWDLLTGAESPSGRLAQQWPISVGGVRVGGVGDYLIKYSTQGGAGWTLGAPFAPAYPFGFGLDYLDVAVTASAAAVDAAAQTVNVTVTLHNAAAVAGLYVVEVCPSGGAPEMHRQGGWWLRRICYVCMCACLAHARTPPSSSPGVLQPGAVALHALPAHARGLRQGGCARVG